MCSRRKMLLQGTDLRIESCIMLAQTADAHLHMPGCVRSVRLGRGGAGGGWVVVRKHTSRARVGVEEGSNALLPQGAATSVLLLNAPSG